MFLDNTGKLERENVRKWIDCCPSAFERKDQIKRYFPDRDAHHSPNINAPAHNACGLVMDGQTHNHTPSKTPIRSRAEYMNRVVKFVLTLVALATGALSLASCSLAQQTSGNQTSAANTLVKSDNLPENQATAVFAMGCFWCAEADFEKVDGVVDVISGYTGGTTKNPTYNQVTGGDTGHYEAILVTYDTTKLAYTDLLSVFWKNVDPFDATGQFCDKGDSYRAAIFPGNAEESEAAMESKEGWAEHFGRDIATAILDRSDFYAAEDYHQDYYKKNPIRYGYYRNGCGRDARLEQVWGKPVD